MELVMWSMMVLAAAIAAGGIAFAGAPGETRAHALVACLVLLVVAGALLVMAAIGPRAFS